jgi:ribose transport system permease protein
LVIQVGRFHVMGTITGIHVLAIGSTGLQLMGVQGRIGDVFNGCVLILAVWVGVMRQGRGPRATST